MTTKMTKAGKAKGKRGKPTLYTVELAEQICERIADAESLTTICVDPAMPSRRTVLRWQQVNDDFALALEQAREHAADKRVESIGALAEDVRTGKLEPNAGRVCIDALRWIAGRENWRRYGDKISSEVAVKVGIHHEPISDTRRWIESVLAGDDPTNVVPLLPLPQKKDPTA